MSQPPLLHDALGDEGYLPIEEEEAGHVVPGNQVELLLQALLHPLRDGAVSPHRRLHAQPSQVGVGGVPLRHGGIGQGIAQVRGQVEGALPSYLKGVGYGFRAVLEDALHLLRRLQVQVVVGADEGQCLVDGGVEAGCDQGVLQPVPLLGVVEGVVGRHNGNADLSSKPRRLPVTLRVPLEQVLLQLHVHRTRPVPPQVVPEKRFSILTAYVRQELGERPSATSGEEDHAAGVLTQEGRVQPRLPAVLGVGQREQSGNVGVSLPCLSQHHEP